jgi:hypothetical protein
MITVSCSACGKASNFDDSAAGRSGKCANCGGKLALPKPSATAQAIQEAMKAMDAKEAKRKGKSSVKAPGKSAAHAAYDLSGQQPKAPAPEPKVPAERNSKKIQITPKQWKMLGAVVAGLSLAAIAWSAFVPGEWESRHAGDVIQVKVQADQLASAGKAAEAYAGYQRVILMSTGQSLRSAELRRAVAEAHASRDRLLEENRAVIERARAASARQ